MDVIQILTDAAANKVSDLFIIAGKPLSFKKDGVIGSFDEKKLLPANTQELISGIYSLAGNRDMKQFLTGGDDDFSFALPGVSRFRVNTYRQRGSLAAVVRVIGFDLPSPEELGIPESVMKIADCHKGMVLVTGPAGSGKSSTLACIIDKINSERKGHIITLEDPLEYLHSHKLSIVSQREVFTDTDSYVQALRASLRQSPDVILLGEMRDYETIEVAMTAAETGHLIFSTLHTIGAASTIERIIDVFASDQQRQISIQLSNVLQAVISQQLVPDVNGRLIPAFEIMRLTPAIRNLIREGKLHQIDGLIYSSAGDDMVSMDSSLIRLATEGRITKETALNYASNPEMMKKNREFIQIS